MGPPRGKVAAGVRGDDLLARCGGDGFLVTLGATDGRTAPGVTGRARGAVESGRFHPGTATDIAAALSAGVVEGRPGQWAADLLDAVDRLLYEARRTRNRGRAIRRRYGRAPQPPDPSLAGLTRGGAPD